MKATTLLIAGLLAGGLAGCDTVNRAVTVFSPKPGNSATIVSGNSASVLIDYANSPAGEAAYADAMAKDKCAIFGKKSAELESLNPRGSGETTRATYSCK